MLDGRLLTARGLLPGAYISCTNPAGDLTIFLIFLSLETALVGVFTQLLNFQCTQLKHQLRPFFVTTSTKAEIPVLLSISHFLSAETKNFVRNQEALALITVLKITYEKGLTPRTYGGAG